MLEVSKAFGSAPVRIRVSWGATAMKSERKEVEKMMVNRSGFETMEGDEVMVSARDFFEQNRVELGLENVSFNCLGGFCGLPHMGLAWNGGWVATGHNCIEASEEFLRSEFGRIKVWIDKFEEEGVRDEAELIVFESYIDRLKEAGLW